MSVFKGSPMGELARIRNVTTTGFTLKTLFIFAKASKSQLNTATITIAPMIFQAQHIGTRWNHINHSQIFRQCKRDYREILSRVQ